MVLKVLEDDGNNPEGLGAIEDPAADPRVSKIPAMIEKPFLLLSQPRLDPNIL